MPNPGGKGQFDSSLEKHIVATIEGQEAAGKVRRSSVHFTHGWWFSASVS